MKAMESVLSSHNNYLKPIQMINMGEGSGRIILDVSKEKGYLRHSKDRDTIAYRFPKDKVENGKSETAQVYAFIVDKINNETDT